MTEQEHEYFEKLYAALKEQRSQLDLMIISLERVLEFECSVRLRAYVHDGH